MGDGTCDPGSGTCPWWVSGGDNTPTGKGYALNFSVNTMYVNCGNRTTFNITDEITITAWVNMRDSTGAAEFIVNKTDAYRLRYLDNYRMEGYVRIAGIIRTITGTTSFPINKWHHVVLLYDGQKIKLFVNGQEDATPVNISGQIQTNTNNLYIGQGTIAYIDEVRIYSEALSSAQVQKLYVEGLEKHGLLVEK